MVCTSAGFLIVSENSTHRLSAVHIATGAVETIDLGETQLNRPLGLALSDTQRVVYVACYAAKQIETVALPDRYFCELTCSFWFSYACEEMTDTGSSGSASVDSDGSSLRLPNQFVVTAIRRGWFPERLVRD